MSDASALAAPASRRGRRGLFFPLLLIALGAGFLAANFGYLPPISMRALLSLWPVLLIVGGIEILVARRQPYLALAIEIIVIAAAVAATSLPVRTSLLGAVPPTTSAAVQREDATALTLRVDGGGGSYTIAGGGSALVLADADGQFQVSTSRSRGSADVRIKPADQVNGLFTTSGTTPSALDIHVASDIPTTLRVSVGAGDFTVDMTNIRIQEARLETGASKLLAMLPTPAGDVPVRIGAGAASVEIVVPDGIEARITTTGGLISTNSQNARLTATSGSSRSSAFETQGYASAKDRVTVTIEAGASSITIR